MTILADSLVSTPDLARQNIKTKALIRLCAATLLVSCKSGYIHLTGLEISENRHLPCITEFIGIQIKFSLEILKYSLALQPEALVNTSGRVLFSSPFYRRVVRISFQGFYCFQIHSHLVGYYPKLRNVPSSSFLLCVCGQLAVKALTIFRGCTGWSEPGLFHENM